MHRAPNESPADRGPDDRAARFNQLCARYLRECLVDVQELDDLLVVVTPGPDAGSTETGRRFKKLAHDLAGSGGSYGFPDVSALGRELEQSFLTGGDPTSLRSLIERLRQALTEALADREGGLDRP